ncbi:MAG: hypothetical protein MI919_31720 [Holophagales bacterium]|nr:hypothetical protein [Holophagales bacterium]
MSEFVLTLTFTGVNAYLFDRSGLTVVMPNALRIGDSPSRELPQHFPAVFDPSNPRFGNHAFRFWEEITIEGLDDQSRPLVHRPVPPAPPSLVLDPSLLAGLASKDKKVQQASARRVSCVVRVPAAQVVDLGDGCEGRTWTITHPDLRPESLAHRLRLQIRARSFVIRRRGFFTDPRDPGEEERIERTALRVIGNLCAKDVLDWPANDRKGFDDADFAWLYEVVGKFQGQEPLPRLRDSECGFDSSIEVGRALQIALQDHFDTDGGGGACGCECIGCIVS